jgi:hypothetical protein
MQREISLNATGYRGCKAEFLLFSWWEKREARDGAVLVFLSHRRFAIKLVRTAVLGPGVYSASNRNEHQK